MSQRKNLLYIKNCCVTQCDCLVIELFSFLESILEGSPQYLETGGV